MHDWPGYKCTFSGNIFLSSPLPVDSLYTTIEPEQFEVRSVNETVNRITLQNNLLVIILFTYAAGICLCVMRNITGIIRILQIIRKGKRITYANHIQVVVHHYNRIAPFSWMKYIIISQADLDEAGDTILMHEKAHIRHRHTIDLCLAELCILFQWYNPAAWLLHRELQAIHEYEADETVISRGIEAKKYQLLLIKKAVGSRLYSMANSFNHSNLKKRITMMLQKKSNAWARLKYVYILPLTAIAIAAFARPEISQSFDEISNVKVSDFIATTDPVKAENMQNEIYQPNNDGFMHIAFPKKIESVLGETDLPAKVVYETAQVTINPIEVENLPSDPLQPAEINNKVLQAAPEDTTVYNVVEIMPDFPGGQHALMKFIAENIKYPKTMEDNGIQGRVIVKYIVTKDGFIRNAKVVSSLCPEGDAEAIRVIEAMPKWTPGKMKGKNVNTYYTVPINFRISN